MRIGMLRAHNPGSKIMSSSQAKNLRYYNIKDAGNRILTNSRILYVDWTPTYMNCPCLTFTCECSCPTLSTACTETAVEQQGRNSNFKMTQQHFGNQSAMKF
eukprot:8643715-Ditylum_brightwellii.AAC.1